MPSVTSNFLFLMVMPGATSGFLLLIIVIATTIVRQVDYISTFDVAQAYSGLAYIQHSYYSSLLAGPNMTQVPASLASFTASATSILGARAGLLPLARTWTSSSSTCA